jgi:hypothetical protein
MKTANPENKKNVNVAQGPKTGNHGTPSKRDTFIREKSGDFRTEMADMVTRALETRGNGMKPELLPTTEPLSADRGPKRNPTAGGTKYNVTTRAPKPRPRG